MIRKFLILISTFITILLSILTIQRLRMDYNEKGVYFDGVTTYDSDAVVAFLTCTVISISITIFLIITSKSSRGSSPHQSPQK